MVHRRIVLYPSSTPGYPASANARGWCARTRVGTRNVEFGGILDGGHDMSSSAPARASARGGTAAGVTRAAHLPPAVVLDVFGRRVRIEPGGHPAAAQVDALWSRCRAAEPRQDNQTETVIALPRS